MVAAEQISLFSPEVLLEIVRPYEDNIMLAATAMLEVLRGHDNTPKKADIRRWMKAAFGGTDATGRWTWKDVYEAQEAAYIKWLQDSSLMGDIDFGHPLADIDRLCTAASVGLTHTRRDDESVEMQQFSTPLVLGYLAAACCQITPDDLVLEPSAGTGQMAIFAHLVGAKLVLNELSDRRSGILRKLFPKAKHLKVNGEQIHDLINLNIQPSVVLMNPPFSMSPNIQRRNPAATANHVRSSFLRLVEGGRMALISADWFKPGSEWWERAFKDLPHQCHVTAVVDGAVYYKNGTHTQTRLSVIDKVAGDRQPAEREIGMERRQSDSVRLIPDDQVLALLNAVPQRGMLAYPDPVKVVFTSIVVKAKPKKPIKTDYQPTGFDAVEPLEYEHCPAAVENEEDEESLYQRYAPSLNIKGAHPHPTPLCESAALRVVKSPVPAVQPMLPRGVVKEGLLSETQLEQVIYACASHAKLFPGFYTVDATRDHFACASEGDVGAVQIRQGYFVGDGTGSGKGRTNAGIILAQWCAGYRKAIWLSKNTGLIADAQRDWVALGGQDEDFIDFSKVPLGQAIGRSEGILFTTYDTLRVGARQGKKSRLDQLIDWAGPAFDGVIIMDECYLLGNAVAEQKTFGLSEPSQRAVAGVRLQNALPKARVVYSSATGATKVKELAYAVRLGLWGTSNFPFPTRSDFLSEMAQGGVAIEEVLCRDLKALGLYLSRNLSFEGVQYDTLEIPLNLPQTRQYKAYADAFKIIHQYLDEALEITHVTSGRKSLNRNAALATRSAFEGNKQRFFKHVLCAMKCPTMIADIEQELEQGRAAVIQLNSTNEAMLARRLLDIPKEEWEDINVDVSPLECIIHYIKRCFPIHLYEEHEDGDGRCWSEPVKDANGDPVISQEAVAKRDALLERLIDLPYLPGLLDQVLWHFGAENVAEVTGRSIRVLRELDTQRKYINKRPSSANSDEVRAFRDGEKHILVFSKAGDTGASYHADLACANQRQRVHYVPEFDWRADNTTQGLGRSHRTNQAIAPIFRMVITDVRGEKRFLSTVARRLNSLGALTRGYSKAGSQGMFTAKDNLESHYAVVALDDFFGSLNRIDGWSISLFEKETGLRLTDNEGYLKDDLPSIQTFMNRLLALNIEDQNVLFGQFEELLEREVNRAIEAGVYNEGMEVMRCSEGFHVLDHQIVHTHSQGATTDAFKIEARDYAPVRCADDIVRWKADNSVLLVNRQSKRAAIGEPCDSTDSGEKRTRLRRPNRKTEKITYKKLTKSHWIIAPVEEWKALWDAEAATVPEYITSTFYLVTGLLLPVWQHFTEAHSSIYRLTTVDGRSLLGRYLSMAAMATTASKLGLDGLKMSPAGIYEQVLCQGEGFSLSATVRLKWSRVMGAERIEVVGEDLNAAILKQCGCFSEIIVSQRRWFVPVSDSEEEDIAVIERLQQALG